MDDFAAVLEIVKQEGHCDLTVYKETTLNRRIQSRMMTLGIKTYGNYLNYLKAHSEEFIPLLNTIWINYTKFFRNRSTWEYLAEKIVPQIVMNKQPHEPIRIWSAGCASGEEAYSLAMVLAEALGMEQYLQQVQIFATDVDMEALKYAQRGSYSADQVANIPPQLLSKYFAQDNDRYVFDSKLRRKIIFGRQNLVKDPPISNLDLLVCRNALIYLNLEAQVKVLFRFHFALNSNGFLFLGSAETLLAHKRNFSSVNLKHRIFTKQLVNKNNYLLSQSQHKQKVETLSEQIQLWQTAFASSPIANVAVNLNERVIMVNKQAYSLLELTSSDHCCCLQDLKLDQVLGLRAAIKQVKCDLLAVKLKDIKWLTPNGTIYLDIDVTPMVNSIGKLLAVSFTFINVTRFHQVQEELDQAKLKLLIASEELGYTKEKLAAKNAQLICIQ